MIKRKPLFGDEPYGTRPCPVCDTPMFEDNTDGTFDVCGMCGWEDDNYQDKHHDYSGGANHMSVNEARKAWEEGREVL